MDPMSGRWCVCGYVSVLGLFSHGKPGNGGSCKLSNAPDATAKRSAVAEAPDTAQAEGHPSKWGST